jgi:hypothetical protein
MFESKPGFQNEGELIEALAGELKPVVGVSLRRRVALWLFVCTVALLVFVNIAKFRGDLATMFSSLPYVLTALCLIFVGVLSGYFSFLSAVPGRTIPKRALFLVTIVAVGSVVAMHWGQAGAGIGGFAVGLDPRGIRCARTILLWSLILGAGSVMALRRLAPTRPRISATWIAIAVASLSSVGMAFHCPVDNFLHVLIWHFLLPFPIIVFLARLLALRLLRW